MRHFSVVLAAVVALQLVSACSGALFQYKASASPGSNPDANSGTANAWLVSLSSGDGSKNGSFQGDSGGNGDGNGAGAGASAWAMYANSGQTATATTTAFSTLSDVSALNAVGQYISLDFDNGWVHNATESGQGVGGSVGITFRDSSNSEQFTFRFLGGDSFYQYTDSSNTNTNTTKGFTDDGFNVKLLLTNNSGGYTFTAGTTTISGTLKQLSSTIASVVVFNNFAGPDAQRNLYFDNLAISTTAIPEVSAILGVPVAVLVLGGGTKLARRLRAQRNRNAGR
jgi:hypothetical protein